MPYYGGHGSKQFIRENPMLFGFKLWCLCSSDGYFVHVQPYCGSDTDLQETGLGQCPNVFFWFD